MAQDADDAMSESSWTSPVKGNERDWWSVDLEGDTEKLEVEGLLPGTEGDPWILKGRRTHRPARAKTAKEGKRESKGAEHEKQGKEMEVGEATPLEASAAVHSRKRKVIRVESEETQDYVLGVSGNQPGRIR